MKDFKGIVSEIRKKLNTGIVRLMGANVLNKVITMMSNMVITRLLSVNEFGIWSYVLNIYSYLELLSGLGLLSGAFQFGAEHHGREDEFNYYKYCLKYGMLIDTIIVGIFLLGSGFAHFSIEGSGFYIQIYAPLIILTYGFNLLLTIFRCEGRITEYARILNINTVLIAIGTCVGALVGVQGVVVGRYLAYIIVVIQILFCAKNEIKKITYATGISKIQSKELWKYSIFTGISTVFNQLIYLLDVSMVAVLMTDAREVAIYKCATLIPNALAFIPNSIIIAVLPTIIHNRNEKSWLKTYIKNLFFYTGLLNFLISGLLCIFAPLVIIIIAGENYLASVPILRILLLDFFISGTFRSLSTNILAAMKRVSYNLFLSIVSGICNIIFDYILVKRMGAVGAAYATLGVVVVASILSFGYLMVIMRRKNYGDY